MTQIELLQRKIIYIGKQTISFDESKTALAFYVKNQLEPNIQLLFGIYCLGLLFMENPKEQEIIQYIEQLGKNNTTMAQLCKRILRQSLNSSNKTENAIKEITKIAQEITHHHA